MVKDFNILVSFYKIRRIPHSVKANFQAVMLICVLYFSYWFGTVTFGINRYLMVANF